MKRAALREQRKAVAAENSANSTKDAMETLSSNYLSQATPESSSFAEYLSLSANKENSGALFEAQKDLGLVGLEEGMEGVVTGDMNDSSSN